MNEKTSSISRTPTEIGEKGAVTEELIGQNLHKVLHIDADDRGEYLLQTVGRIGCDAVIFFTIGDNDEVDVVITHYDPEHQATHVIRIDDNVKKQPKGDRYALLVIGTARESESLNYMRLDLHRFTGWEETHFTELDLSHLKIEEAYRLASNPKQYQPSFTRKYIGERLEIEVQVPGTELDYRIWVNDEPRKKAVKEEREQREKLEARIKAEGVWSLGEM